MNHMGFFKSFVCDLNTQKNDIPKINEFGKKTFCYVGYKSGW